VLDEAETRWSELQRHWPASALLTLTAEERQLCDRRYHGQWTIGRLARSAGVDEAAMRKRLQRIREKLRKEARTFRTSWTCQKRGRRSSPTRCTSNRPSGTTSTAAEFCATA